MVESKAFKVAGIKNLIENNYEIDSQLIDVEAEVDDSISMKENWMNIKDKVKILCKKKDKILLREVCLDED